MADLDFDPMDTPPTRQHVLYALDCAVAQWIKARHLTEIHGRGQVKRYQRATVHLEHVQGDLNAALFKIGRAHV